MDPAHSEILFKVNHMVIASVTGKFDKFDAVVHASKDDFTDLEAEFTAEINSINTHQSDRDAHLKSVDFFDAVNFPTLTFRSTGFKKTAGDAYLLTGEITIRGTTKSITLNVEFTGIIQDPWGMTRAGFELSGMLNRKEFGLQWSVLTETGGMVAGDEVKLMLNVELVKQSK
jgi:polyisoprenoid-binding protein YceI